MENKERTSFKSSWFYKWFVNNKTVTILVIILLFLLNMLLVRSLSFIFEPIGEFISVILLPLVLAAVFYFLLAPLVDLLEKRRVPRVLTIILLFLVLSALLVWGISVAIPNVVDGLTDFTQRVPSYVRRSTEEINNLLKDKRFAQFRPQIDAVAKNFGGNLIAWSQSFSSSFVSSLTGLVSQAANIFISLVVFPFVLFYLLLDGRRINTYLSHFLPNKWRNRTSIILTEMGAQIASYVRGQVIVAILVTIMLLIGLPLIGLRYAVPIAIFSGLLNLIPFLGFWIAIIPACVIGLATGGPFMLLWVIIIYTIEQTLESRLISPLVLGSQLNIHPVTIIFILLTAGKIFGVWGVILAIPIYAAIKVILTHFFTWYKEISTLYLDDETRDEMDHS